MSHAQASFMGLAYLSNNQRFVNFFFDNQVSLMACYTNIETFGPVINFILARLRHGQSHNRRLTAI